MKKLVFSLFIAIMFCFANAYDNKENIFVTGPDNCYDKDGNPDQLTVVCQSSVSGTRCNGTGQLAFLLNSDASPHSCRLVH